MSLLKSWLQKRKSIDNQQKRNDQQHFCPAATKIFYDSSLPTRKSTKKLENRLAVVATNSISNINSSSTLPPLSTKTASRNFLTFYKNYGTGSKKVFSRKNDEGLLNSKEEHHQQQHQYDDDRQNNDELITLEKNGLEERRRQVLDDKIMEKNRQQTYDELEKALRLLADEFQPLVARSTPKNYDHYKYSNSSAESNSMKSDDTSSSNFDQKSMQHCLFEQPVYDHMIEDSLKTVHQLKNSLDLLATSCTVQQKRT